MPPGAIRLSIPARREALGVVRAVIGGAASSRGFGIDRLEEARLAVNEAAVILIEDGRSSTLLCELSGDRRLDIALQADPGPETWPPPGWPDSLECAVLMAVTDTFELTDVPGVRLSLHVGR
jgi:anti-sigma regulatory factor (Ser/Thr protein kinase)